MNNIQFNNNKYRHLYGEANTKNQYNQLKPILTSGESNYISVNDKFLAVSCSAKGWPICIKSLTKPDTIPTKQPLLYIHTEKVLDHDFNPFIPNIIATVSADCTVSITLFPMTGLNQSITKSDITMFGHSKKVVVCKFNPTANCILATASKDRTIKIWNIEYGQNIITFNEPKDSIYSMQWNNNGSQIAMIARDKKLRIFDPRMLNESCYTFSFEESKSQKVFWMNNVGWIGATGYNKTATRELKFWDLKKLSKPIFRKRIDKNSPVLMPYYDNDLSLLFMYGKGSGCIRYGIITNDSKKYYPLSQFRSAQPQKGGCFVPKRICNVWKCEINKFLKVTRNYIEPISFIVPRGLGSDDIFHDDIYPDVYAGRPTISGFKWMKNINNNPIKVTMNPDKKQNTTQNVLRQFFGVKELIYGYIRTKCTDSNDRILIDGIMNIVIDYIACTIFRSFS